MENEQPRWNHEVIVNPHTAVCCGCDGELKTVELPQHGEIIVCSSCGMDLEVVSVNPDKTFTVAEAPGTKEDFGE